MQPEVDRLYKLFDTLYGLNTEIWLIPTVKSHHKLMGKVLDFIDDFDKSDNLFIVYYAGHGSINENRQSVWSGRRDLHVSVDWSSIQSLFDKSLSDVLLLLDCCSAASSATISGIGVIEVIAACGFESVAAPPGKSDPPKTPAERPTTTRRALKNIPQPEKMYPSPSPSVSSAGSSTADFSFPFTVNSLPVNEDPNTGGVAPIVDAGGRWIPPATADGFSPQIPGNLYRCDRNGAVSASKGYQLHDGFWWGPGVTASFTPLATYRTATTFFCNPWVQFLTFDGDASAINILDRAPFSQNR